MKLNKLFFFSIAVASVMMSISIFCGPSTDELYQQPYGKQSFDFYSSLGSNDSILNYKPEPLMRYYGALIDTIPEVIYAAFPSLDLFILRHIIIALFSSLYLIYGFKIGDFFGGKKFGIITFLILAFLPRIMGEAFNNPKDTPFAATYIMSIYYTIKLLANLPKPSWADIFKLAIAVGLCISVRIGGVLIIFYLGLFGFLYIYLNKEIKNEIFNDKKIQSDLLKKILSFGFIAYFVGILFWPSALVSPISFPIEALSLFSKYPVTIKTLFEGKWIPSTELPNYYLFKYIFITNPEVVLIGMILMIYILPKLTKQHRFFVILLLFSSLFPVIYVIYKKSAFYTGWRHTYFTFLPLAVISGIAWSHLMIRSSQKYIRYISIGVFIILLSLPIQHMARNFPHFYIYFNTISGGVEKNYGKYDIDYYAHTVNKATFWINKNHPEWLTDTTITVVSNTPYNMSKIIDRWHYKKGIGYVRYRERYDSNWDIGIFCPQFVDPAIMQNRLYKSKNVIHSIDVDGLPVGIIIKREDKNDFYGKQALDSNNFPKAIEYLTKALQYDPNNEIAWTNLGMAQLQSNLPNDAITSLNNALKISPESMMAKNYLAYAYLQTGNVSYAQSVLIAMLEENPNMPDPYRLLAQIYQQQGNTQMAQQYMSAYQQLTGQMGAK